jgi:predicted nucleotidyltransferase
MLSPPFIAETMRQRIEEELAAIEHQYDIQILLAIESGSRAWGFPSVDSDYDVRFIYAHRIDTYLSIESPRDVIERPIDRVLDISGWDLRKALRLVVRSNPVVFEWLASPVQYKSVEGLVTRIRSLSDQTCFLPALAYHYDRMARHSFDEVRSHAEAISLKTYCYALRPCLARLWIRQFGTAPPMDLPTLLEKSVVADDLRKVIFELVELKAAGTEETVASRVPALDDFISGVLSEPAIRPTMPERLAALSDADALFRSIVRRGDAWR